MSGSNEFVEKDGAYPRVNEFTQKFINDMLDEKKRLGEDFPLMTLLADEAIDRAFTTGHIPGRELYADVFKEKPLKVMQKVYLPVKEYPFNFTGKILGPKGNSLRRLQQETQCRIVIKGRNSMRDKSKEEALRQSGDYKYAHFQKDLYLEISAIAPPAESHARIAYALAEIRKYIIPDNNDEISQEQFREINEFNPQLPLKISGHKQSDYKKNNSHSIDYKYQKSGFRTSYTEPAYERKFIEESYESRPSYSSKHQTDCEYGRVSSQKRSQPTMSSSDIKYGRDSTLEHNSHRHSGYKNNE